jgi:hypothetical protein
MMTRTIATVVSILMAGASVTLAQTTEAQPAQGVAIGVDRMLFNTELAPPPGVATFEFISSEMTIDGKIVKGQPYSAEGVTETTQVLGDGNRISRKTSASLYRDSEGRTRREQTLPSIGPWSTAGEPVRTVFINDPVAGTAYTLNEKDKTAHKLPGGAGGAGFAFAAKIGAEAALTSARAAGAATATRQNMAYVQHVVKTGESNQQAEKTEDLGTQNIEGVPAKGTRTTVTIPAGEIGNEKPISIINERWYSPDMGVVLMTKHVDPRVGETVYRLTNVQRSEPSKTLFQVPADFRLTELGDKIMMRKLADPSKDNL